MILYHYTTMDTFISMMEHSLFHQNDNLEPTHLIMWAGHSSYQMIQQNVNCILKDLEKLSKIQSAQLM